MTNTKSWRSFLMLGVAAVAIVVVMRAANAASRQDMPSVDKTICSSDVGCDVPPQRLSGSAPEYPRDELISGRTGKVSILFTVNPDGTTSDFQVESATTKAFADASIAAIRQWKYEPAKFKGEPIKWQVRQVIPFKHGRWDN